ncbi:hypothetical protein [Microbacterium allomyrinae]|uniref:Uncharacterized protein n=1 Tax=Microbacterium allomyrinae TaxID=2830666 RepID=A0A9X1S3Z0_9MICO|nr:hypothetical protein [Microbacterium allomyrinae]MCC2032445.1 hypothetical protein [Microbacterium allomyrinae]
MSDPKPQTREEYQASLAGSYDAEPLTYQSTLEGDIYAGGPPAEFLPLNARRTLFLVGIAALFAGPLLAVQLPEYGDALVVGGNLLAAVGLGTALANPTR